ncbi:hypothetical protein [Oceanobacillus halophilus]|uniref:Uncharacterized protein n=1 Tax=Oceanobacillus halophilus TaxID=930130 RepID=A0A495A7I1_9BACI|nr:hypothetical protein [Oceanobacillus halophilus]RKQ35689.1 hypothetical protein D8M06_05325 [Oceanobacillus halophilus]
MKEKTGDISRKSMINRDVPVFISFVFVYMINVIDFIDFVKIPLFYHNKHIEERRDKMKKLIKEFIKQPYELYVDAYERLSKDQRTK